MGKNFISATEAKRISETTDKLISVVFKHIKFEAENGYSEFYFNLERMSKSTVGRLHQELQQAGFAVLFYYEDVEDSPIDELMKNNKPIYMVVKW